MVLMVTSGTMPVIVAVGHHYFLLYRREKKEVPFSMAVGNGELMQECFPPHAWERNMTKKQKKVRRKTWVWKEVKQVQIKKSQCPITTKSKYINKHNTVLFYRYGKSTMKFNKPKIK